MPEQAKKPRFVTLDVLRGYFILIIIVDHLNRFPSWFAWLGGQGRLWVSAGEGFIIISGLLVGYTRGFKKISLSMNTVVRLLYKRALVLYICSVVASAVLLALTLHSQFPASLQPSVVVPSGSFLTAINQILTLRFVFEWVYFLKFYIASLLIAPYFIFLLRKKQTALAVVSSVLLWALGYFIKQDWLQWQILFFLPAVLGFHLETLQQYWQEQSHKTKKIFRTITVSSTVVVLLVSSFWVFGWELVKGPRAVMPFDTYVSLRQTIDPFFYKIQLSPGRIVLSFVCFAGLYLIFNQLRPYTTKYVDWLLLSLGKSSLVVYIIHGFIILPIQVFIPLTSSSTFNTFLGIGTVIIVFVLSQSKSVKKIVPS